MPSEIFSLIVAFTGVVTSALLAYLAYSLNRQSQRTAIHRSIGDLYEKLMNFRTDYPEMMQFCHQWTEDCFNFVYHQTSAEDRQWALYYTYAELIIDFSNTVIYGRKSHLLDRKAYENHYKPLVKLLLTEHYPFISSIITGPYLSSFIKDFVKELEKEGWDWSKRHRTLIGSAPTQAVAESRKDRI